MWVCVCIIDRLRLCKGNKLKKLIFLNIIGTFFLYKYPIVKVSSTSKLMRIESGLVLLMFHVDQFRAIAVA